MGGWGWGVKKESTSRVSPEAAPCPLTFYTTLESWRSSQGNVCKEVERQFFHTRQKVLFGGYSEPMESFASGCKYG